MKISTAIPFSGTDITMGSQERQPVILGPIPRTSASVNGALSISTDSTESLSQAPDENNLGIGLLCLDYRTLAELRSLEREGQDDTDFIHQHKSTLMQLLKNGMARMFDARLARIFNLLPAGTNSTGDINQIIERGHNFGIELNIKTSESSRKVQIEKRTPINDAQTTRLVLIETDGKMVAWMARGNNMMRFNLYDCDDQPLMTGSNGLKNDLSLSDIWIQLLFAFIDIDEEIVQIEQENRKRPAA